MPDIIYLQLACFIVAFMLAIYIAMSRLFVVKTVRRYELSRWLFFTAMVVLAVHYTLQMTLGFRSQGADVASLVNILFYVPTVYLVTYAVLNVRGDEAVLRFYRVTGIACHILIYAAFILGVVIYGNLHLNLALTAIYVIFALTMLFFISMPLRQIYIQYKDASASTLNKFANIRLVWMLFVLLTLVFVFVLCSIVSIKLLFIFGPILLLTLTAFVASFIAVINNISLVHNLDYVNSFFAKNETSASHTNAATENRALTKEREEFIRHILTQWCEGRGYRDNAITLKTLARRLAVSRIDMSLYFDQVLHTNFRIWLSDVRFQAAKNIMIEHPEYSNETISEECGFSSRSQLYKIFKDNLGVSPGDWKIKEAERLKSEKQDSAQSS
ncbi:MAG: helix-turn-helix domain-containing protein [Prevotella sp.]